MEFVGGLRVSDEATVVPPREGSSLTRHRDDLAGGRTASLEQRETRVLAEQLSLYEEFVIIQETTAGKGIQTARSGQADLLIMDVGLPDMDGLEVLQKLRHMVDTTPIVVISAHGTINVAVEATRLGAFDFNSRNYADDDLIVGSADPFQLFRIMNEIVGNDALSPASGVNFMLDQCHNIEPKIPGQIRSVMNVQEATAKALLVDREALAAAHDRAVPGRTGVAPRSPVGLDQGTRHGVGRHADGDGGEPARHHRRDRAPSGQDEGEGTGPEALGQALRGVGPVGFHRDDVEAVRFHQPACDGGAGTVELGRAVGGFA